MKGIINEVVFIPWKSDHRYYRAKLLFLFAEKYCNQRGRAERAKLDQTNGRGMDSAERYAEQLDDDLHYRNNSGANNVLVSSTLNVKNTSMWVLPPFLQYNPMVI